MKHKNRKAQVLKRKNFFPTLIVTVLLWGFTAFMVYFLDPGIFGAVPLFFVLIFLSLLFTFSLLFANSRRGFIATSGIVVFLILAYLGVGNFLNFALIAAIAIAVDLYFSLK